MEYLGIETIQTGEGTNSQTQSVASTGSIFMYFRIYVTRNWGATTLNIYEWLLTRQLDQTIACARSLLNLVFVPMTKHVRTGGLFLRRYDMREEAARVKRDNELNCRYTNNCNSVNCDLY
eukprot:SAG11_NODE_4044_length_2089_cov_1.153769_2_plen_120_part_00